MYDELKSLIAQGKWDVAEQKLRRIEQEGSQNALFAVLKATVCEAQGDHSKELLAIADGLAKDWKNYELFYMLGLMYRDKNINQAYLCMRQAEWYCAYGGEELDEWCNALCDNAAEALNDIRKDDLVHIRMDRIALEARPDLSVRGLSIVILSYNDADMMKDCLKSIRQYHDRRDTQVIVVDNASSDGVAEWLRQQEEILLVENGENVGFSLGCNIGVITGSSQNDILILNNDTYLTPNAIFWLRMALYEAHDVGAAGPLSNNAAAQTLQNVSFAAKQEWVQYASGINIPMLHPYEDRCRLTGFAVMLKREAADSIMLDHGMLFDPVFSPAYFEDDDLGMRIARAGYRQLLCHNSLVWHAGGQNEFQKNGNPVMESSREKFIDKWGFDMWGYELPWEEVIEKIEQKYPDHKAALRILQIDCGMGVTLAALHYLYPNAYVAGIERNPLLGGIGRYMADIMIGNGEDMSLPYAEHSFDVVIIDDTETEQDNRYAIKKRMERNVR